MKKFLALLLATLMVCAVFAGCGSSSGGSGYTPSKTTAPTTEAKPNPEYEEIFTSRNIIDMPALFLMMDSMHFASVDSEGMIEKMEYGYKDDIVQEMINTVYYPLDESLSEDDKALLDEAMQEAFIPYTELSFCKTSFNMGNNYYTIKLEFTDLDNADNVLALQDLGMIEGDDSRSLISMEQTEANMLSQGYIKR